MVKKLCEVKMREIIFNSIIYIAITFLIVFLIINDKIVDWKSILIIKSDKNKVEKIKKYLDFLEGLIISIILVIFIQKFYLGNFLVPTESMYPTIKPRDRIFGNMFIYKFTKPKREDIIVFKEPIKNEVLFTKRLLGLPGDKISFEDQKLFINDKEYTKRFYISFGDIPEKIQVPSKGDIIEIETGIKHIKEYFGKKVNIELLQKEIEKNKLDFSLIPNIKFYLNGNETGKLLDLLHYKEVYKPLLEGKKVKVRLKQDYYFVLGDNTEGSLDSRVWGFVAEERIKGKPFMKFWPISSFGRLR